MTGAYAPLLAALIALLVGLTVGKAWERYKLRDGRWFDRRKARDTPHYMLGLNFLVSNQPDLAIEELTKAATVDSDALEIDLILGNLYREKGQVGRAIQVHQTLLQRPKLKRLEHAYALLCLGLDYKSGGFVDRAFEAFSEVLRLDPDNEYALLNLEKLHEEQHQWQDAYALRQRRAQATGKQSAPRSSETLAFLENELGLQALAQGDRVGAAARFTAAIDLDARAVPAYLHLGDVQLQLGRTAEATATWERAIAVAPERAYLAFDRLVSAYVALGDPDRFPALCRRLIAAAPKDWRGRVALAQHLTGRGQAAEALDLLFEALTHHPHGLVVHRAAWQTLRQLGLDPALVDHYVDLAGKAVFYLDPHVCTRCRYRSTELLWHCPHCHEWNSFVEERMAAAKDGDEADS
jgi:lipopolysaccharide biosynthesis regulator YciM